MHYITDYITKAEVSMPEVLGLFHSAIMKMDDHVHLPATARAKALLTRCINSMTHKQTIHSQQCARYLLGRNDTMKSHSTFMVMSSAIVDLVRSLYMTTARKRQGHTHLPDRTDERVVPSPDREDGGENGTDADKEDRNDSIPLRIDSSGRLVSCNQASDYL